MGDLVGDLVGDRWAHSSVEGNASRSPTPRLCTLEVLAHTHRQPPVARPFIYCGSRAASWQLCIASGNNGARAGSCRGWSCEAVNLTSQTHVCSDTGAAHDQRRHTPWCSDGICANTQKLGHLKTATKLGRENIAS